MKAVILAGGLGTRISEETHLRPKPMIEIGGKPILWHIMKIYSSYGINEFIVCSGYKGYIIKEYFQNYFLHNSDVTFTIHHNQVDIIKNFSEEWKVTVIDTGENTNTGGRLKRIKYLVKNEPFCMTYGDGVSNMNISKLIEFHNTQKSLVTLTAVQPPARFGALQMEGDKVTAFKEKPPGDGAWINGGFMIIDPKSLNYIQDDTTSWEENPLKKLAEDNKLSAYKHNGFWQPMDTLRDKHQLEEMWNSGKAPWKIW